MTVYEGTFSGAYGCPGQAMRHPSSKSGPKQGLLKALSGPSPLWHGDLTIVRTRRLLEALGAVWKLPTSKLPVVLGIAAQLRHQKNNVRLLKYT